MHQGSAGIGGSAVEVEVQADDLRHTRDTVLGIIAEDTGQPFERILRGLAARPLVHRGAGRDYGFIDHIVGDFEQVMPTQARTHGSSAAHRESRAPSMSTYTIPNVIAQHPRGERIMDVYSHLLSRAHHLPRHRRSTPVSPTR